MASIDSDRRARPWKARIVGGIVLAAAGLVLAAPSSSASQDTNYCNNETETNGDYHVDLNNQPIVGVDPGGVLEATPPNGVTVCIADDSYLVTVDTTGAVTVSLKHCTALAVSSCTYVVGPTGLVRDTNRQLTVSIIPTDIDTGYDLYINGTFVTALALP